jgi:type III pantothenate kinase
MFLAIDLGNTSIKYGIFDAGKLVSNHYLDHPNIPTILAYQNWLKPIFSKYKFERIVICSVKPQLRHLIVKAIAQLSTTQPQILTHESYPKFQLRIDQTEELGMDLLVDSIATNQLYASEAIIIDVGTATKVMAIRQQGFEGVAIAPGISTSFKALNQHTSLIKTLKMVSPQHVFGKNTTAALSSGIILGHIHMLEGLVRQGITSLGWKYAPIILTGGYAHLLLPFFTMKVTHDANLSLKGIQLCQ